jgi:YidC/Oxa1 family membrane protein insertase
MDNQRLILIIALGFVLFLIWQAWTEEHIARNPPPEPTPNVSTTTALPDIGEAAPGAAVPQIADVPVAATPGESVASQPAASDVQRIRVITDEYIAEIDPVGATLSQAGLIQYPKSLEQKDEPFELLQDTANRLFIVQSGLLADGAAPDHRQVYQSAQNEYRLQDGQDHLEVPFTWSDPSGIKVTKTYIFHRDRYAIDVTHKVENASASNWTARLYQQLQRTPPTQAPSMLGGVYTYTGGVVSTPEKNYEKIDFDDMQEQDLAFARPWA